MKSRQTLDGPLPASLDAERAVLGAILLDNAAWGHVSVILSPGDFFFDSHRHIFACMIALGESRRPIDLITLSEEMQRTGELEGVGGSTYLASLTDGLPRISNVGHHARIVRDKSILRRFVREGEAISQAALEQNASIKLIQAQVCNLLASPALRTNGQLHTVTAGELLKVDLKPREMILDPVLPTQSLAMVYSKRGVGKTFFSLGMAYAVASGGEFLGWRAPKPRRVLFVDGELPANTLRERLALIIMGTSEGLTECREDLGMLRLVTPDLQEGPMPDLATREGQVLIEDLLEGTELLILDNLSCLCRSGKENEGESWLPVQGWALRLRQRGISVLFAHHAGKGGAQRGTSRREDALDLVIALRHPPDYVTTEGLRAQVHFEKCRALLGGDAKPFEVRLESGLTGQSVWTIRTVEDTLAARAAELFAEGLSVRDVAEELHISKSQAHRLRRKLESGGIGR